MILNDCNGIIENGNKVLATHGSNNLMKTSNDNDASITRQCGLINDSNDFFNRNYSLAQLQPPLTQQSSTSSLYLNTPAYQALSNMHQQSQTHSHHNYHNNLLQPFTPLHHHQSSSQQQQQPQQQQQQQHMNSTNGHHQLMSSYTNLTGNTNSFLVAKFQN